MSLFSVYKTNQNVEVDGFWFEDTGVINDDIDKTTPGFLIARASRANPRFAKATEALGKKYKRQFDNDLITGAAALEMNKALFLDTLLLDWRNVYDADGEEIPFSRENADKLFAALPDLYDLLEEQARKASNFREADIADTTGN